MAAVAEMAGSTDPAAFVRATSAPADVRGRGAAKAKGEKTDAFDSQLDAVLSEPSDDVPEHGNDTPAASGKARAPESRGENDTEKSDQPQPQAALPFNPWIPVAPVQELAPSSACATINVDAPVANATETADAATEVAASVSAWHVEMPTPPVPVKPQQEPPMATDDVAKPKLSKGVVARDRSIDDLPAAARQELAGGSVPVDAGTEVVPSDEGAKDAPRGASRDQQLTPAVVQAHQPAALEKGLPVAMRASEGKVSSRLLDTTPESRPSDKPVPQSTDVGAKAGVQAHVAPPVHGAEAHGQQMTDRDSQEVPRADQGVAPSVQATSQNPGPVASASPVAAHEPAIEIAAAHASHQAPAHVAMPAGMTPVPEGEAVALATPASGAVGAVPEPDTPDRLVQSMRLQFLRGGGDAIVQLRPEHLGPVTVSVKVEQGGVTARIVASDPVVAEWLQAHQQTLRDGLQSNGLALDRFIVDRDGQGPERRDRRQPQARQRFRTPAEPQSTFELTI